MDIRTRILPTLAILKHDMGTLASSWLVRLWFFVSGFVVLMVLSSHWGISGDGKLIAWLMFPYLVLPWFLVVMMLGVGPVAGNRAESLADGILSRPVTRYEYLLASWASRVITVLGIFLIVVVPAILLAVLAERPAPDDPVTSYGVLAALFLVCLVLTLQVSLAFLLGTLLRRQMVAVVLLVLGWFLSAATLGTFQLEELSPFSLCQAMPTLLQQPWSEAEPSQIAEEASAFRDIFKPIENLVDASGPQEDEFMDSEDFEDVSLWRVTLGYGLPTMLAIGLATLVFCRRDL